MRTSPSERTAARRSFLHTTSMLVATAVLPGALFAQGTVTEQDDDVSTNEDLMREHGILKRVLLIYDEVIRRIDAKQDFPPNTVSDSANVIRKFIEDYHEKLEEEHLFPRFRQAHKLVDLVDMLYEQHQAGRRLTDRVLATIQSLKTSDDSKKLAADLRAFIRMYAPHERIRSCFPPSTKWSRRRNTKLWASSSTRSSTRPSAATALTSTSTK